MLRSRLLTQPRATTRTPLRCPVLQTSAYSGYRAPWTNAGKELRRSHPLSFCSKAKRPQARSSDNTQVYARRAFSASIASAGRHSQCHGQPRRVNASKMPPAWSVLAPMSPAVWRIGSGSKLRICHSVTGRNLRRRRSKLQQKRRQQRRRERRRHHRLLGSGLPPLQPSLHDPHALHSLRPSSPPPSHGLRHGHQ